MYFYLHLIYFRFPYYLIINNLLAEIFFKASAWITMHLCFKYVIQMH